MIHRLLLPVLVLGLLTTWRESARADIVFVTVTGQVSGEIHNWYNPYDTVGDTDVSDYGWVYDFAWNVISPRDAASGLPTGKRMHKPVSLRLRSSAATVLLANCLAHNENLTSVEVFWFATDPDTGAREPRQRLYLINANLASFSTYTVREQDELVTYVDVTMTYQKIGIEDYTVGAAFEDDWETPIN
jgi:type VI secretion system secreted protein Hcp